MWVGLGVFVYAVGAQIPRELRLYLQTREDRRGVVQQQQVNTVAERK